MNKQGKAAIAVGAGILLLLGGGGTFAVWNGTSSNFSAGTVTAGTLTVSGTPTVKWYKGSVSPSNLIADISTYRVVPGDSLVLDASGVSIAYQGSDLYFYFTLAGIPTSGSGYTIGTATTTVQTGSLPSAVTGTHTYVQTIPSGTSVYPGSATAGSATLDVQIPVSFDATGTANTGATVSLANVNVAVQQVIQTS